ncbi:HAL/PAL/TAL family ammonia-lyase [Cohnella abietis]|uniref:Phenylalanine ammonia-lyase n=1 Tax=Cohnella abietis TaxID=2507935 RepID=A0A3T1DBB7_9BACL|nr:aromatic amino acid ammonia-lyase [Cohnella abietis]BBI35334.1 phenylalanine ammonia-lyase [Cohnella abietis]
MHGDVDIRKIAPVELDGHSLTLAQIEQIAKHGAEVLLNPAAEAIVAEAHKVLCELAAGGRPIYGLNRGVGVNKDRPIDADYFEAYNRNLILSHSSGIEPWASDEQVRAIMVVRLNTLLIGCAGVQPSVVRMYVDFLNHRIHPALPLRGSIGAADISLLSHIGLAMIGEGIVSYGGQSMDANEALAQAGLTKLRLGAREGLAIVSSNALSAGLGAIVLQECRKLLETADVVYALSLEAIHGCRSPLDEGVYKARPFKGAAESAKTVRRYLEGGQQGDCTIRADRIQDPLSFRSACQVHGAARDALAYAESLLLIQLNSSDDNPCLLVDDRRIVPNSNFDVTTWTLAFEMLGLALSHVSKISCSRSIKLGNPDITGLTRFLTPDPDKTIGLGTLQKTFTSIDAEIRHLAIPVSPDSYSISGDMEDHSSHAPFVVRKTGEILDRLYFILGMEAMNAAQAIDLRNETQLGQGTLTAYKGIRSKVSFLSVDRPLTGDIAMMAELLRNGALFSKDEEGGSLNA